MASQPEEHLRPDDVQVRMKALRARDLQLWSMGLLVLLVLATGFVSLVLPNMVWRGATLHLEVPYLPQLVFGLLAMTVLFNLYSFEQRRELNNARETLLSELLVRQRRADTPVLDALTGFFDRRFLEYLLPRESARARRLGTSLALVLVQLRGLRAVERSLGELAQEQYLREIAELLERVFRPSDTLVRYGEDQFLAVMPQAEESQAAEALSQVAQQVEAWNRAASRGYKACLLSATACCPQGADANAVLRQVEQELRRRQHETERPSMSPHCLLLACSQDVVQGLRPSLEELGLAVEIRNGVEEGLDLVARHRFEAVVLECQLPEEAAELAHRLRALPSARNAILIAVLGPSLSAEAAFKMGANFVLPKPFTADMAARSLRVAYGLMVAERRRYFRHPLDGTAHLTLGPKRLEARMTNLSEGGMALQVSESLEVGRLATLRFTLPGSRKAIELKAEIGWTDLQGNAGLRFVSVPDGARRELDSWLLNCLQLETELAVPRTDYRPASRAPSPVAQVSRDKAIG